MLKDLPFHFLLSICSRTAVSFIGALNFGVYQLASLGVSKLVDKYGCRLVCMGGGVLAGIMMAVSSMSTSAPLLMGLYGVGTGIGFSMVHMTANIATTYHFEGIKPDICVLN